MNFASDLAKGLRIAASRGDEAALKELAGYAADMLELQQQKYEALVGVANALGEMIIEMPLPETPGVLKMRETIKRLRLSTAESPAGQQ